MTLRIITDSTCDISPQLQQELNIDIVPLKVLFGDEEYLDGQTITKTAFYEKLSQSKLMPSTSQVNPEEFLSLFQGYLKAQDEILGIFLSSELSGTFQSAMIAKRMLDNHPNIHLVDSRNVTFGLAFLIFEAIKLRDAGQSAEQIAQHLDELKQRVVLYGVLNTLEYLKRGGRLSASSAIIGGLLSIKPLVHVRNGFLINDGKARGLNGAYELLLDKFKTSPRDPQYSPILAHANAPDLLDRFKEVFQPHIDVANCPIIEIGSVVGTHAGPGAVGIVWVNKEPLK